MAVDMFLKIDTVTGESQDATYKGAIDILSWSFGMQQNGSFHFGHGGGAGKVSVNDITITKYVDKSTPNLIAKCCTGEHFTKAQIIVRKAGEKALDYIKITLDGGVLVTSVSSGGSAGEERLTETIGLNFSKFKYDYTPQSNTGTAEAVVTSAYDMQTHTAT